MKVVICANDFRAYFPPRLINFGEFLKIHESSLVVIELFSESICYQFSKDNFGDLEHHILFNGRYNKKISMREINYKLREKLNEINPDVIISSDVNFPAGAEALHWTKKHNKGQVIYTNSRSDSFQKCAIVNMIKRNLLSGVEAVLCPASAWDESMMKLGFRKEQIFYGLNTGDNDFWSTPTENIDFKELPKNYFLHVGRHITQKNLVQFSKAYKEYRKQGGKRDLILVGEGYTHNDIVNELKNTEGVIFLKFQPREKLRQIYNGAYALFLPSYKQETWGMVVNEAMCCGCPVVVSDQCGASTTIVKDGINGFIHNPDDINSITKIMHKFDNMSQEMWLNFSIASKEIIKDWGLSRFSEGAWNACQYAITHPCKTLNPLTLILRYMWQGRIASDDL